MLHDDDRRRFAALWGAAALVLVAFAPLASRLAAWVPACPWKTLTTIPCPFCGTTRAAVALAGFEPWHALVSYPLPTLFWILAVSGGMVALVCAVRGRPLPEWLLPAGAWPRRTGVVVATAVLLNWMYSIATDV